MVILENYKKVLNDFIKKNGNRDVAFFAVLKMDELVDKWSILVSADWINGGNDKAAFSSLIGILQKNLGTEELSEIARIVFYPSNEHLVNLFFDKFSEGQVIREDARVNGNIIHEGYILALRKTLRIK